jgi:hypothetical protein
LGFTWDISREQWEEMFASLAKYKEAHGHCSVPFRWLGNPNLGQWVATQRAARKKGRLDQEQIRRLESLGFRWQARR